MKLRELSVTALSVAILMIGFSPVHAGLSDVIKDVQEAVTQESGNATTGGTLQGLSEEKVIQGLKEALATGSEKAVDLVAKADGYYNNPEIKIPLPDKVQKMEKLLRSFGLGSQVDAFEMSMNRAAEQAAPEAKAMFLDTIKEMTIEDAKKILNGKENEATLYFKEKTEVKLAETFQPIVHSSMESVGVTRNYQSLSKKAETLPFAGSMNLDLDGYVTSGALDGLFLMLAEEEKKIRKDPVARVTDLLKDVFGGKP